MLKYLIKWFVLTIIILNIIACASSPPGASLTLQAAKYLNPDINGQASPVVVTLYQLKSPFGFDNADYDSLAGNSAHVLGSSLIDKQTTEIRPGQITGVNLALTQGTEYIGIVAAYRDIDQTRWHTVVKLPTGNRKIKLFINLESAGISAHIVK